MFSVLRPVNAGWKTKCHVNRWHFDFSVDETEKTKDLFMPGSYMPWQLQPQKTERFPSQAKSHAIGIDQPLHEAGHALACAYEDRKHRLTDVEFQLKFVKQFDVPVGGSGLQASLHESRAHGFGILLAEAIDPDDELGRSLVRRSNVDIMAGHCHLIATGNGEYANLDPAHVACKKQINDILDTHTPAEVLQNWKDLCKWLADFQEQAGDIFLEKYKELEHE